MPLDTETFDALLATIRRYVAERLRPLEAHVAETDEVPPEIVREMREMGLFGLSIPDRYGGLGLDMREEVRIALEFGRTSPAFRSVFGTNVGIGSQGLVMAGSDAQKAEWLPRIASGEVITSFALTEPGAGSDSASVSTRAVRDPGSGVGAGGDSYRLSGTKRYITNADKASLFTVMARTGDAGAKGVSAFLVPTDLPGITIGRPETKMGQQGAHVCDVHFDDVPVPAANRLGAEGEGFGIAMRVLDRGRLHIAAVCTGIAERLVADCVAYATERRQFGKPIADFQLIQAMIADSKVEAMAARALVLETAALKDTGTPITLEAAAAKYFASEAVGRVADRAVQIFGGAGYIADYGIERLYRDVRLFRIYEGTSQIQQLVIARETLKRGG
ncbi:acyl-CoA dehydrogenase family protein [Sphingosinicella sp. BN140058]|uniref:acyl-CoA dehydrogenase family protein n=1 Tax=Sphingosinicella sp. BN140058 TaxID=1892855 RepID=UPI0010115097|nr:acyl-CoA dehydrogenase family protein [Sphingosinicella sp. BN140058]QAY78319.1 acyl-CoA dehydrogenase [Sphingosinicella sp. BN140058]